ncbi:hypothetical protein T11_9058 [Trichinella zimbabwensis]|uniref:Uncharacterized protein n=1 Tax=Trichinella zimbabwensis TaxID=268475 RepID=A0A0V1H4E4_9BILA|nr:hypothetical protein T11_9058 [Trichinella zimbabwensis]
MVQGFFETVFSVCVRVYFVDPCVTQLLGIRCHQLSPLAHLANFICFASTMLDNISNTKGTLIHGFPALGLRRKVSLNPREGYSTVAPTGDFLDWQRHATRDFAITKLALSGGLLIPPLIFYPLHPFHRVRDPSPVDFDLRQCLAGSSFLDLWWWLQMRLSSSSFEKAPIVFDFLFAVESTFLEEHRSSSDEVAPELLYRNSLPDRLFTYWPALVSLSRGSHQSSVLRVP